MEMRVCSEMSRKEMPRSSRASRNFSPIVMAISKRSRLFCVDRGDAQLARRLLPENSHLIPGRIARNFKPQTRQAALAAQYNVACKSCQTFVPAKGCACLDSCGGGG